MLGRLGIVSGEMLLQWGRGRRRGDGRSLGVLVGLSRLLKVKLWPQLIAHLPVLETRFAER